MSFARGSYEAPRLRLVRGLPLAVCVAILTATSCLPVYDPPPEVELLLPEQGWFAVGTPVPLAFSEPIDADSLTVRVWAPEDRDIENSFSGATPLVDLCGVGDACDEIDVAVVRDDAGAIVGADIAFDDAGLGRAGNTVTLEVLPGLADEAGNDTGVSFRYDFTFLDPSRVNTEPVPFDDGVFILISIIDEPIPSVLTLVSDVVVLPDGRFFLAGGDGDPLGDAPESTDVPEEIFVDDTKFGWSAHVSGFVSYDASADERLLETEPFDLLLPLDPLEVRLFGVRLNGRIVKDPDTSVDRIEGTLSYQDVVIARTGNPDGPSSGSGSTAVRGEFIPRERRGTLGGHPFICGDQCGVIFGRCAPPEDFPGEGVCEEIAELRGGSTEP